MTAHKIFQEMYRAGIQSDPGDAGALNALDRYISVYNLTSAGAETRTLNAPTKDGQLMTITCGTYVGDIVVTSAVAVNQTGNTIMTFGAARDTITLVAVKSGSTYYWSPIGNDGVALS